MSREAQWPQAWPELLQELGAGRGQPALLDRASGFSDQLVHLLAKQGASVLSLGQMLVADREPGAAVELLAHRARDGALIVTDIDVLFTPRSGLDPMSSIRRVAQSGPVIVAWPGSITAGRLAYSRVGRFDYYDVAARDVVVLRHHSTSFPDEVPYTLERFPQ